MLLGGKKMGYVFDFSNPKAVDALCKFMGDLMARNGIDGLVCDFGIDLAHYWDLADGVDRAGLTEIKYQCVMYLPIVRSAAALLSRRLHMLRQSLRHRRCCP